MAFVMRFINDLDRRTAGQYPGADDGRVWAWAGHQQNAGRDHWTNCMSMLVAGGGMPSGQVIGSTDSKGYDIKSQR